ncbi:hypothetical protein AV530_006596 [Patagioenas fasciata monilis]|uniref:Uncharacterized protein n=1 Tax=Patagioenas fasciata monilis TaxID=372326 RepID=A0A1V4KH76_PATFA|nr:hypothetical protein AV530_006596 [Patagioenas fasciata monilis]
MVKSMQLWKSIVEFSNRNREITNIDNLNISCRQENVVKATEFRMLQAGFQRYLSCFNQTYVFVKQEIQVYRNGLDIWGPGTTRHHRAV